MDGKNFKLPLPAMALLFVHLMLFLYVALVRPMAFLQDDAYYSLTVAANIASGQGITYGGFPTNGFQPLYAFLLTPLFAIFGDARMFCLKAALILCGIFSTASLYLLYRMGEKWAGKSAAMLALVLCALSINLLSHSASGLETSMHAFLFLLTVYFYTKWKNDFSIARLFKIGLLLGVLALARLDACFIFIAIAGHRFWINRKNFTLVIKENLIIFIPACLILAPWIVWNLATFGTIFQSSGAFHHWRGITTQGIDYSFPGFILIAAIKIFSLAIKLLLEPLIGYRAIVLLPANFVIGKEKLHTNPLIQLWHMNPVLALSLMVVAGILIFILIRYGKVGFKRLAVLKPFKWVLPALVCAGFFYTLYHINYSMRHFYAYSLLLAIPVAVFITGILGIEKSGKMVSSKKSVLVIALLIIAIFRCGPFDPKLKSDNEYGFKIIEKVKLHVPVGSSIGYTDCGFYGYFLTNYTIVNLDGILNFGAQRMLKQNKLSEYLRKNNVEYVLKLDNFNNEYRHQFDTDLAPVLQSIEPENIIFRLKNSL